MEELHIRDGILELYTGREALAVVPEGVHTIGEGAFKACVSLKKVALPSSLRRILAGAFKGCRNLEEIEIPEEVSYVGEYAFHRCHSLKKIALPLSVKELGDCVFLYCDSLEEARIPGVRRLGVQVFVNDVKLRRLEVSEALEESCICDVFTGCGAMTEVSVVRDRISEFPSASEFPLTVGDFSEEGKLSATYQFPNAVEAVAGELPLPSLVRTIALDILRMMELEGRCMVTFRTNLKHVEIPEGIERIGKSCFFDKRGILSVKFPGTLREIGSRAFRNCINLEKVIFQGENVSVHEDAFKNCSSLKYIHMPEGAQYQLEGIRSYGGELPGQVQAIQKQVLGNFRLSGSILLKYLGEESRVAVPEGITRIAEEAFAGNEAVDRVLLPESLEEIGAGAFRGCVLLQTAVFPEKLKRIGAGAFENCVKLLRVSFPRGMTEVEEKSFKKCRALKEVCFGEGIRSIGEQAFYGCAALKEVRFPESLEFLGEMAFYRCGTLREVRLPAAAAQVGSLAFAESGLRRVYISGSGSGHGTGYGTGVFSDCGQLKSLVLEEGVCHIADRMAYGCVKLQQVQLPDSIQSVGRNVWEKTPFLEDWLQRGKEQEEEILWDGRNLEGEVRLSEKVRIIAGGAFYGNRKLTYLFIPKSVKWVGAAAFKGCSELRKVVWDIGENGPALNAEVFSGCVRLQQVVAGEEKQEERLCQIVSGEAGQEEWSQQIVPGEKEQEERLCQIVSGEAGQEERLQQVVSGDTEQEERQQFVTSEETQENRVRQIVWRTVGERAFYRCRNLKEVCLDEVIEIGQEAFSGCTQLNIFSNNLYKGKKCLNQKASDVTEYGTAAYRTILDAHNSNTKADVAQGRKDKENESDYSSKTLWIGERAFEDTPLMVGQAAKYTDGSATDSVARPATNSTTNCGCAENVPVVFDAIVISGNGCHGEVYLEEGITGIAPFAFSGNKEITRLVLPESLERIGEGAFWGCSSLAEVRFPESSCRINARAFEKCASLSEVRLHAVQLQEAAFAYCTSLKRVEIKGKSVLSERLFEGCVKLKECICKEVRAVKAYCFSSCVSLEHFDFSHVSVVKEYAFAGCDSLRRAEFPESACIGAHSFEDCGRLEEIVLLGQQGDVRLREYAFSGCTALASVTVSGKEWRLGCYGDILRDDIPELARLLFHSAFGCFEVEKEEILRGYRGAGKRIRIPEGIRRIEAEVFRDIPGLEEIEIPDSVEYIGARAFHGTGWLDKQRANLLANSTADLAVNSIVNPVANLTANSVTNSIKSSASNSTINFTVNSLENLSLNSAVNLTAGSLVNKAPNITAMVTVNHMLLDGSQCVGEVVIPEDIRLVCGWAFANGMGIKSIRFLSEKVRVEEYAFRNCIYLEEIILGDGTRIALKGIEDRDKELPPLAKQAVMDSLNCFKTDEKGVLVECTGNISRLRVAEGITAIGEGAFQDGNLLTEILLPMTVKNIGRRAFAGCKWLKTVRKAYAVEEVGDMAFFGCGALEEVELSEKLQRLGIRAFENCTSLEKILIPEGVEEIPDKAFYRCHSLRQVHFPASLKRIGKEAFAFCRELEEIRLPEGVLVDDRAFVGCGAELEVCEAGDIALLS